jgi:hypothetical protein
VAILFQYGCWAFSWTFDITYTGHTGWFPKGGEPGDVVCMFEGSNVPHLLRRPGSSHYKVLGKCYIHGIMYGKAMTMDQYAMRRSHWYEESKT